MIFNIIIAILNFVFNIFLILYLNDDKKFENQMSDRNKKFRVLALVIAWINVVSFGIFLLILLYALIMKKK